VTEESYGRFAHIMDPEGRKIELWEPKPMPEQP
jgi:predicted enzyme related to lactoylglutathione lyase